MEEEIKALRLPEELKEWKYIGDTYRKLNKKPYGYWERALKEYFKQLDKDEVTMKEILEHFKVSSKSSNVYKKAKKVARKVGFQVVKEGKTLMFVRKEKRRGRRKVKRIFTEEEVTKLFEEVTCPYCGNKIYIFKG